MRYGDSFADVELSPYKWVAHSDKLMILAQGGDVFPVTVELDLVDFCNHKCWWCVDPVHNDHVMERPVVSRLLGELKRLGVEGIVYKGGGEPTLHESFADVISETKSKGFELGVVTNGSRLVGLYQAIVENASYLRVSIDGPTAKSHHTIHGSNDFDRILRGVDLAVKFRKAREQRHPIIGISFAMDYPMLEVIPRAAELGDRLGVDYILLRPPFYEEVGRQSRMTTEQKRMLLDAFERERRFYNGDMKIFIDYWISDADVKEIHTRDESPRRGKYIQRGKNGIEHITGRCLASPMLAVVAADKRVYPCCNLRAIPEWSIGVIDYENGNTFESIWHSERRKVVMKRIHNIECIKYCTHPMSRYNEVIEYLRGPQFHKGFV